VFYVRFATLVSKVATARKFRQAAVSATCTMMLAQAHAAQVRKANFPHEIAPGISLPLLSLYRGACYTTSVMVGTAPFAGASGNFRDGLAEKEVDPR
jgi:hypothetical protein